MKHTTLVPASIIFVNCVSWQYTSAETPSNGNAALPSRDAFNGLATDLPAAVALLIAAAITAFATLAAVKRHHRNKLKRIADFEKLRRVNSQISEFHGPLRSLSQAACMLWVGMAEELDRHPGSLREFFEMDAKGHPSELSIAQLQDFKRYVREVFQPLDAERERIILEKFHLAAGDSAGECLWRLVAHIAQFRAVVRGWDNQRTDDETLAALRGEKKVFAFIPRHDFPKEFDDYVRESYDKLKAEQEQLYSRLGPSGGKER